MTTREPRPKTQQGPPLVLVSTRSGLGVGFPLRVRRGVPIDGPEVGHEHSADGKASMLPGGTGRPFMRGQSCAAHDS